MLRHLRELFSPLIRNGRALVTMVVVVGLVIAMLSASTLFAAKTAIDAAPELPEPEVDVSQIENLNAAVNRSASQASIVLDTNGDVLGRFKPQEMYLPFETGEVPELVERVLTASEDENFRQHAGFDPRAIARAMVRNAASGEIEQGGSTLTQQLAKNLFIGDDDSLERKLEELQVAIDLEDRFTKDEILTAYANSVFLGNGAFGFEAAALTYFDKPASEMTLSETALLVGVLPAPTTRDPRANPAEADQARRLVLERVAEVGAASDAEIEQALAEVPEVLPPRPNYERFPYYMDYVRRYLLDDKQVDPDLLYGGGLTIETAMDPELQFAARFSVLNRLPDDHGPEAALAVVDVRNGLVTALVGGRHFDTEQVNLALGQSGAGSGRQAGSSFKPFVLAAAFERGVVPHQTIGAPRLYLPRTVDNPKPVHNFTNRGYGVVTLIEATVRSINTAFVNLTEAVGARAVRDTAEWLGIRGLPDHVGPSIGIGAYETSPLDMATAYASFANEGHHVDTGPVRRLLTPDGEVLADFTPTPGHERWRAISTETARQINSILQQNMERGTATRAQIGRPAAAKTGTSNDYENAWLVGHTPVFSAAVWVGFPEGNISMRGIQGFSRVTGGSIPALIWKDVMAVAHEGVEPVEFYDPAPAPDPTGPLPGGTFREREPDDADTEEPDPAGQT